MLNFYESPSFGSHGYCAPGSNRGHLYPFEKPTIDLRTESIVATPAILIRSGELEEVMANFHENPGFSVGAALRRGDRPG